MFSIKALRLSNFRSILEMLGPEGHCEEHRTSPADQRWPRVRHESGEAIERKPQAGPERPYVPLERLAGLYSEEGPDIPQPVFKPADDATVASELHLDSARTSEELQRLRRSFAMRNHPDRVPSWLRAEATRRMTIANALIDRAMRDKQKNPFAG